MSPRKIAKRFLFRLPQSSLYRVTRYKTDLIKPRPTTGFSTRTTAPVRRRSAPLYRVLVVWLQSMDTTIPVYERRPETTIFGRGVRHFVPKDTTARTSTIAFSPFSVRIAKSIVDVRARPITPSEFASIRAFVNDDSRVFGVLFNGSRSNRLDDGLLTRWSGPKTSAGG